MTERDTLLRAVCENPDDDTVRLAFADWCDENGEEERAEFIRLQCRRSRGVIEGDTLDDMHRRKMRELALWEQFGERWLAELPSCAGFELDWGGLFVRGFAGDLLSVNPALSDLDPWIDYERQVPECSALDWERILWSAPITRLHLWNLSNWGIVFERPEAARLKSVVLYDCGVDVDSIKPLLPWARRTAGQLAVKQETLSPDCERQLRRVFAARFEWRTFRSG